MYIIRNEKIYQLHIIWKIAQVFVFLEFTIDYENKMKNKYGYRFFFTTL